MVTIITHPNSDVYISLYELLHIYRALNSGPIIFHTVKKIVTTYSKYHLLQKFLPERRFLYQLLIWGFPWNIDHFLDRQLEISQKNVYSASKVSQTPITKLRIACIYRNYGIMCSENLISFRSFLFYLDLHILEILRY